MFGTAGCCDRGIIRSDLLNHIAESNERCEANVGGISSILLESENDALVKFPVVEVQL